MNHRVYESLGLPDWWTRDSQEAVDMVSDDCKSLALPAIRDALDAACSLHDGQFRKGGGAYIVHPCRVFLSLHREFGVSDPRLLVASLLHDVIEDCDVDELSLRKSFSDDVVNLVKTVSRGPGEKRPPGGDTPRSPYLKRVSQGGEQPALLKLCDKLDNLRDAAFHPDARKRTAFINETRRAYLPLSESCGQHNSSIYGALENALSAYRPEAISRSLRDLITADSAIELPPIFHGVAAAFFQVCGSSPTNSICQAGPFFQLTHVEPTHLADNLLCHIEQLTYAEYFPAFLEFAIPDFDVSSLDIDAAKSAIRSRVSAFRELIRRRDELPFVDRLLQESGARLATCLQAVIFASINEQADLHMPVYIASWHVSGDGQDNRKFQAIVTTNRMALLRLVRGEGSVKRATEVIELLNNADDWAARLFTELIDSCRAGGARDEAIRQCLEWYENRADHVRPRSDDADLSGWHELRGVLQEGHKDYVKALEDAKRTLLKKHKDRWIIYDTREFTKRLRSLSADFPPQATLENGVVRVRPHSVDRVVDRLQELGRDAVARLDPLTPCSIHDAFIDRCRTGPLWLSRLYRLYDTINDLWPENCQEVELRFHSSEQIPTFRAWHPLPASPAEREGHSARTTLFVRYLVAQLYNACTVRDAIGADVCLAPSSVPGSLELQKLLAALSDAEQRGGYGPQFRPFIDDFHRYSFEIRGRSRDREVSAEEVDPRKSGVLVGIDIGGTNTKIAVFRNGVPERFADCELLTYPTVGSIDIREFFTNLIHFIDARAKKCFWTEASAVGISWAGAVRNSKVVGVSKILNDFRYGEQSLANVYRSVSIKDLFLECLVAIHSKATRRIVIVNDGNAEAFGNFFEMRSQGKSTFASKIVLKLGTSLAGGRIQNGALVEEVAEFSKAVMDLSKPAEVAYPKGVAREFVSSVGLRNLSREFRPTDVGVFDHLQNLNDENQPDTRVESVEVGLFAEVACNLGPEEFSALLNDLCAHDNSISREMHAEYTDLLAEKLDDDRIQVLSDRLEARNVDIEYRSCGHASRLEALLDGRANPRNVAGKSIESLALVSQLSLHVAHLVAVLYNVYRRGTFQEVILAGGVLHSTTGTIVRRQASAFLLKYYDKIYGRHLSREALVLNQSTTSDLTGVFGAAMYALIGRN